MEHLVLALLTSVETGSFRALYMVSPVTYTASAVLSAKTKWQHKINTPDTISNMASYSSKDAILLGSTYVPLCLRLSFPFFLYHLHLLPSLSSSPLPVRPQGSWRDSIGEGQWSLEKMSGKERVRQAARSGECWVTPRSAAWPGQPWDTNVRIITGFHCCATLPHHHWHSLSPLSSPYLSPSPSLAPSVCLQWAMSPLQFRLKTVLASV